MNILANLKKKNECHQTKNCCPIRVMKGLSGMKGNFHVPFLEEGGRVIAPLYSASINLGNTNSCLSAYP